MIFYAQEYHDDKGATIIQHHVVEGIPPNNFPIFVGIGYIKIPTPMGEMEERIQVPIEASNLIEAFANFKDTMELKGKAAAQEVVDRIKQQIMEAQKSKQSRIVTADQIPPNLPPFKGIIK